MTRAQNSPKGLFQKNAIKVGSQTLTANSTGLLLNGGTIVANSTGITLPGVVTLSGEIVGSHASKAVLIDAAAALPGAVSGIAGLVVIDNSTGQCIAINTTGTTWKYLNVTADQPT